ncbi:MAG: DegT/DnrJ/EryC1/StrS family aminotransferase [Deltaproteobacteria bacterium]|nr:DegT/DnrJ/EryC1/StrS family aminotransferase [Deltaproteobacteria bacterium]
MRVPFSYLNRQFAAERIEPIFADLKAFVQTGDFTLGRPLQEFETRFAGFVGTQHALGVNSGTDALLLSLKALGVGPGDEVITCAETFIATAGAIAGTGARPVFVDVNDVFTIDVEKIEAAITAKTRAIVPVYFTGNCPDMPRILEIAERHRLPVVEDSCGAIDAAIDGKKAGSWGVAGTFSFHPLKNLNIWSDGGMVTTNSAEMARKISLLRNHGLVGRDEVESFGLNSRLDTLQAVVALRLLDEVKWITDRRIANAEKLDRAFAQLPDVIEVPRRPVNIRHVFHLYMVRAGDRDRLLRYCGEKGVEAKVHYPIPLPLQKCCSELGHQKGDFPKTERDCSSVITFPAHQHLTDDEMGYMIETVRNFYTK